MPLDSTTSTTTTAAPASRPLHHPHTWTTHMSSKSRCVLFFIIFVVVVVRAVNKLLLCKFCHYEKTQQIHTHTHTLLHRHLPTHITFCVSSSGICIAYFSAGWFNFISVFSFGLDWPGASLHIGLSGLAFSMQFFSRWIIILAIAWPDNQSMFLDFDLHTRSHSGQRYKTLNKRIEQLSIW